jgi:hypothetical protein
MSLRAEDILTMWDYMAGGEKSTEYILQFIADFYAIPYDMVVSVITINRMTPKEGGK